MTEANENKAKTTQEKQNKPVNLDSMPSEELGLMLSEQYNHLIITQNNIRNIGQVLESRRGKKDND